MSLSIVAIKYLEPEYKETVKCINDTGLPVIWVDRNPAGIGSLAEAINRGVKQATTDYVWIVTNITFFSDVPKRLLQHIGEADVIHPVFKSDHKHLREGKGIGVIPFCEFTAAMVRRSTWMELDEQMPYMGHDLDYGYRVWKSGGKILCDYTTPIGHVYIRNAPFNKYRAKRLQARRETNHSTKSALKRKYGEEWKEITWYKTERQIGEFYEQVKQKCFV